MADATPFQRTPVDRGYRILVLAYTVQALARAWREKPSADDLGALAELGDGIHEEAAALVDALEKAAQNGGSAHV